MLENLKDYTKCAVANKFVSGSYLGIPAAAASMYFCDDVNAVSEFLLILSAALSITSFAVTQLVTSFGLETLTTYKRTKGHIQDHDTIDSRFGECYSSNHYCSTRGFKLAAKEEGLENLAKEYVKHVKYI